MSRIRCPDVTLIPLSELERDAFVEEEIAGYADQQVRDAAWPRDGALERARAELTPVLNRELQEEAGHLEAFLAESIADQS